MCSTQSEPGDLESLCGRNASEVEDSINELCDEDSVDMALEAYEETCSGSGYDSCKSCIAFGWVRALLMADWYLASDSEMTMTDAMSSMMSSMMSSESEMSSTIALTSTYYDEDCSCTTTSVISTVIGMSGYGGASGTGAAYTGTAGGIYSSPTESSDSVATDGLDSDDGDDDDDDEDSDVEDGTSTDDAEGAISTGTASRNDVGSFIAAVGAIAFAAVAL